LQQHGASEPSALLLDAPPPRSRAIDADARLDPEGRRSGEAEAEEDAAMDGDGGERSGRGSRGRRGRVKNG